MFTEKPSCIKELKQLANSLTARDVESNTCIEKVKEVVNNDGLSASQKITKLKEICKDHGK
jgi:hypothetical protein